MRLHFAEPKMRIAAESELKPLAKRGQASAHALARGLQTSAGIGNADDAASIALQYPNVDASAFLAGVDAVTDGVLDERQKRHRWTLQASGRFFAVERELQTVRHAHLHDFQVRACQLQLPAE